MRPRLEPLLYSFSVQAVDIEHLAHANEDLILLQRSHVTDLDQLTSEKECGHIVPLIGA